MKKIFSIAAIVCALYFIIVVPSFATQNEHGCQWKHIDRQYKKVCPTDTPISSPIGSPSDEPTSTPSATPSETVSPTPTSTESATPSPSDTPTTRTDLSDGRSDGLGCAQHDCNTQKTAGGTTSEQTILPATGAQFNWLAVIGGTLFAGAVQLIKVLTINRIK